MRRHHRRRECATEFLLELLAIEGPPLPKDDEGDELLLRSGSLHLAGSHLHPVALRQGAFDRLELNPVAVDLHLCVDTPKIRQLSRGEQLHQIASTVDAAMPWVIDELLHGEVGA